MDKAPVGLWWKPLTKLTAAQQRVLHIANRDGSIIFGGIDATPGVRRDVVTRLAQLKLLTWKAPTSLHEESCWVLTTAGKTYLSL